MKSRAVLLAVALVLLGGCIGGIGDIGDGGSDDATRQVTDSPGTDSSATGSPSTDAPATDSQPTTTDVERTVNATFVVEDGENVTVSLEVADEPQERRTGLMHRESLADNTGMVFVYPEPRQVSFWMKNTLIPLDMIFVGADRKVLNVQHAEPQPNASNDELRTYPSDGRAKYVVELPRGFANRTGVGPGTELVFNGTAPTAEG